MAQKEKMPEVKFITSLALAVIDKDDNVQHIQIVLCQEIESGQFRIMFDVVDPDKVPKFAEQ